jgi:hypothetical protein
MAETNLSNFYSFKNEHSFYKKVSFSVQRNVIVK